MAVSLDAKESVLGANNSNNAFDSTNVTANADGSVLERLEDIATTLAGSQAVTFEKSESPSVDEDGGRFAVSVSVVDVNSGPIASGSIDITAITYSLEKSTAGGAFSTAGVTQPSGATKAAGIVRLEFDIDAAEWAAGDRYRLEVGAITATVGSTTYHSGTKAWSGTILNDLDVITAVNDMDTDMGEPSDAATDPSAATGTVFSKLRGVGNDTDSILADTGDGTDAAVGPGLAGSLHAHIREVQDDTNTIITATDSVEGNIGANTDVATDPSAGTGTIFSKIRGAGDNLDTIIAQTDSLETSVGANSDVATDPSAGTGSLFSKLRGAGDNLDSIQTDTTAILVDTGDGTDAVVAAGVAGSLHGHIRSVQVEVNKIGTPAGASVSADVAAVKADTAAVLVDTGDGTDAAVQPGIAGSLHAHIRETQTNVDTVQTEVNKLGTPAGASVSADIAAVKTETAAILVDTGDGTDAAVAAGVAGSLHGHIRSVQVEVNKIGTPAGASVSADIAAVKSDTAAIVLATDTLEASATTISNYVDTLETISGTNADAATDPSAATGTLFSKIRGAGDNLDTIILATDTLESVIGTPAGASIAADLLAIDNFVDGIESAIGNNAEASTDPSAATGTLFSKIRGVGDDLDTVIAATDELEADVDKLSDSALTNSETTNSAYYKIANGWEVEAATAAADASVGSGAEENLLDKGADAGTPRYKLESALCNVAALGTNTSITFRLKSEINGTLTQVGNDVVRTGTGAFDLMSLLLVTSFASRHVRVTVTGNNAANDGSVAATFISSKAGV